MCLSGIHAYRSMFAEPFRRHTAIVFQAIQSLDRFLMIPKVFNIDFSLFVFLTVNELQTASHTALVEPSSDEDESINCLTTRIAELPVFLFLLTATLVFVVR